MSYELSEAQDFEKVLQALSSELDADNIGAVHGFFRELPVDYDAEESELEYISDRGLEGLENLASMASYFSELRGRDRSKFTHFTRAYPGLPEDLESILTPVNQGFSVGQASSTRAKAGFAASQLVNAGLAEKRGARCTYRMTGEIQDYRMVADVVERLNTEHDRE